ncbi:TetR family transcriptional regulator [Halioglobus sp. HI00S01]|uniref:TetR/AcrR family transcriptional regulator n=1 Tax=Halioglobus sp. HI00S01 TaxID=1822214 RepID=UPI0007C2243E|nr:TetR/AcrR family transcriptional regulator [Halioglobus sp. HI00S01]KZX60298.1 TetR family transcriptional regulator [Halioglobus sp. HI00S01]
MSSENLETRERILESAWTLLAESHASAVRMSDIAKRTGISRQAVYLHFPTRAELLIATTRYIDQVKDIDKRLAKSRSAASGLERLNAYVEAWGNYIPEIYGVASALIAMQAKDDEAGAAWADRMGAVRHGCEAAVAALKRDGTLTQSLSTSEATDLLWCQLSVENWEHLRYGCGWSQTRYIKVMQQTVRKALVD